jgi:hypothetical protein
MLLEGMRLLLPRGAAVVRAVTAASLWLLVLLLPLRLLSLLLLVRELGRQVLFPQPRPTSFASAGLIPAGWQAACNPARAHEKGLFRGSQGTRRLRGS